MSKYPATISVFKKLSVAIIGVVIIFCFVGIHAYTEYSPHQTSFTSARAIALKLHPGEIIYEELEQASELKNARYFFDIKHEKSLYEVTVNVNTGKTTNRKV